MTQPRLVMHHCPGSICLLQVHLFTLSILLKKVSFYRSITVSHRHLHIWNSWAVTSHSKKEEKKISLALHLLNFLD